jgi:MtrB/PioB family decaheme-associated outer membrane protein
MTIIRLLAPFGIFALALPVLAAAQTTPPAAPVRTPQQQPETAAPPQGWVDFGVRFTGSEGDAARYERYRDLDDGLFLETFRHAGERHGWRFELAADHVARRDQRYFADLERPGLFRVWFEWDQIPLLMSRETRTPYTEEEEIEGVLRIDDDIQRAIQAGEATLDLAAANAQQFEARYRRHTARLRGLYTPNEEIDVRFRLDSMQKHGNMPWGAPFGFNLAVEVPLPFDHRTTDLGTDLEWNRGRVMLGGGYAGSWFSNEVQTLLWDNPIRLTDTTNPTAYVSGNGTSQGRMALWPDTTYHVANARAAVSLPRRSRLSAFLALGTMRQDESLLPHTINTAILNSASNAASLELARANARAEAQTTGAHVQFTTRPWRRVSIDARYRLSEFDNQTEHLFSPTHVRMDQVFEPVSLDNEPYSVTRHQTEVEATVMPASFPTVRAGWRREIGDRTFRIWERTSEDTLRLSMDAVGRARFTVRALYELGQRNGDGLDLHVLEEVGEQPGMRHFDVAERSRQRFTLQALAMPLTFVSLNGSIAVGEDDYNDDGEFGLRDNTHRVYTAGATYAPSDRVAVEVSYGLEQYDAFFLSRQANTPSEFNNPARNWAADSDDTVHTVMASADLLRPFRSVDLRFAYDFSASDTTYLYQTEPVPRTLPEGSPLPSTLPAPQQLPPVTVEWHRATADAKYFFTERLALGVAYWFEDYDVQDFALSNPLISDLDLPGGLLIGYRYQPYTAHTGWVRLIVNW